MSLQYDTQLHVAFENDYVPWLWYTTYPQMLGPFQHPIGSCDWQFELTCICIYIPGYIWQIIITPRRLMVVEIIPITIYGIPYVIFPHLWVRAGEDFQGKHKGVEIMINDWESREIQVIYTNSHFWEKNACALSSANSSDSKKISSGLFGH